MIMCCEKTAPQGKSAQAGCTCRCGGQNQVAQVFWSKAQKIRMAENMLACLRERVQGLEEFIKESQETK
jgi:hypothetical protein